MTRRIARLLGLRLEIAGSVQKGSSVHQTETNRDRRLGCRRAQRARDIKLDAAQDNQSHAAVPKMGSKIVEQ